MQRIRRLRLSGLAKWLYPTDGSLPPDKLPV